MELTIEIRPKPGKLQELYQTLQAILPTIRRGRGCRECRISLDKEVFSLSSNWETRAGVERFMRSTSGAALLGAIDVLSDEAAVRTDRGSPRKGIGALKRMRKRL